MRRRRSFGLRPRLLAALVFTAAVTLGVAALALLPPLQQRLTDQAATDLETATDADARFFEQRITTTFKRMPKDITTRDDWIAALNAPIYDRADTLRDRTGARVIVATSVPNEQPIVDTDFPASTVPERPIEREIVRALTDGLGRSVRVGDDVIVTQLLSVAPVNKFQPETDFVLATTKPLSDVIATVHQVRNAFLAAAGAGLLVAVILAVLLATTLGRRLARLRAAAALVTREGPDAPVPRDEGRDEVGDLARSLAGMQRALRRQEAARRAFVATASHELRTPLTSLQGTLELLAEDLRDGHLDHEDALGQVARAQHELRRLGRLATELLDLSRLDAAIPLREEPVELGELCRAVAAEFELRAGEGGVELDTTTPPGPCWGRGDPDAVARVVRILLDNALRYAPPGTRVHVLPAYHGEHATVEVGDEGPGVAAEDRERIFERFERGSAPSGKGGFGLGLAIGRELARRMGGELRHDDGDAPGARFVLELAIELPSGSHPEPEPAPTTGY